MQTLGFEEYQEPLKIYLQKFREAEVGVLDIIKTSYFSSMILQMSVSNALADDETG
jgi:hypothetical protein